MVLAFVALFAVLGGGAYAAKVKLKANQVKTKNIASGAVTEPKIANGAVTKDKIAAGVIPTIPTPATPAPPPSSPITQSAANANAVLMAATDIVVAQLGGVGGTGTLNTSSFTTPNHAIVVNFSSDLFAGGASNILCKLQGSINGGGFTDTPNAANSADVAAVAPAGGADDHSLAITSTINGSKGTVDLRVVCNSFNAAGSATFNNLSAVAYPKG